MAFSTYCITKGCGKVQEPYLDPQNDKVYCSICDGEITNLTSFVKMQLKSSKQFKKKQSKSFTAKCLKCNADGPPKLLANDIVCGTCSKPLDNLSVIFKNMLKEKIKNNSEE